ncbi:MAG: phosphate ABC transporter permease subunit PstC [Paludibacteraceae bacterium]|nr:phosphate ABC transporter permease subunit PstC [Paludibacteraceae bacterium]MDD6358168.1 phosphate ABC transporter permease subunit PstC [Bacteroidales bacterium]
MLNHRLIKDKTAQAVMYIFTCVAILMVFAVGYGLYRESAPLFKISSVWDLISSNEWKPLSQQFGFASFIMGTIWVTTLAIAWVLPISLMTAVYLTEYAHSRVKRYVFPALDILAGLPSVIYGVWGALLIVPWVANKIAPLFDVTTTGYNILSASIVLGVMCLPLLVSLFIEIFSSIPSDLREASLALGATRWQTTKKVVLRKSLPGIIASVVLAVSRALGETIAVLMVVGGGVNMPHSPFDSANPLPALIASYFSEMMSLPICMSALMFAALVLFVVVFVFNLVSRIVLYRIEKTFV